MILKNGDSIEVKKIESKNSGLALNSSYPKAKLFANSHMLTTACKNCEVWDVKDIIYAVGVVNNKDLKSLFFTYGVDYAASDEIYIRVKDAISKGILTIPDIEFAETNELGRVNKVDPLGITYLRIRGMWHIQNPMQTFDYAYKNTETIFNVTAIINDDKYNSFKNKDEFETFALNSSKIQIIDIKVKTPDNPVKLKNAKLITIKNLGDE